MKLNEGANLDGLRATPEDTARTLHAGAGYGVNGTVSDPKDLDGLRTAIRFYKAADSAQASDTTSYFMGATSLTQTVSFADQLAKVPCH